MIDGNVAVIFVKSINVKIINLMKTRSNISTIVMMNSIPVNIDKEDTFFRSQLASMQIFTSVRHTMHEYVEYENIWR